MERFGNLALQLLLLVVMPIGLTVFGAIFTLRTSHDLLEGIASRSWPSVAGIVRHSGWKSYQDNGAFIGDDYDASSFLHEPNVAYEYSVDGHAHVGRRVAFGDHRDGNLNYVKGIVARYPVGILVSVYFDPLDPGRSTLETGYTGWAVVFLCISLFFLVAGIAWCSGSALVLVRRTASTASS